jgi:hypothetical protein
MVSAGSKGDEIMLVSDVLLLGIVEWVIVRNVSLDASVLLFRWTIHCQQLLRRFQDGGLVPRSVRTFRACFSQLKPTIRVESMLNLFQ